MSNVVKYPGTRLEKLPDLLSPYKLTRASGLDEHAPPLSIMEIAGLGLSYEAQHLLTLAEAPVSITNLRLMRRQIKQMTALVEYCDSLLAGDVE